MNENNQKADRRGGKREGAGRKPGREALSVRQLREFERVAAELAKEFKMSMQEVIGRMVYDESAPRKDRLTAAKLYWDKSVIPVSEGGEADQTAGPAIFLPEQRPHLEVVEGKKDAA